MKFGFGCDMNKWLIKRAVPGLWYASPPPHDPSAPYGRVFDTGAEALAAFARHAQEQQ